MNEQGSSEESKFPGLPILELLSKPPVLIRNFSDYLAMIESSLSFAQLPKELLGANESRMSLGMKALSTSTKNITDPVLLKTVFKLIARKSLINLSKLDQLVQLDFGVEPFLVTAIEVSNAAAVEILIKLRNPVIYSVPRTLQPAKKSDLLETMDMACRVFADAMSIENREKSQKVIALLLANLSFSDLNSIKSDSGKYLDVILGCDENGRNRLVCTDRLKPQDAQLNDPHETISLLMDAGIRPDMADNEAGYYPLHQAAALGHWKSAIALLNGGAELDAKDKEGMTAFDRAEKTSSISNEMRAVFRSTKMRNVIFEK